MRVVKGFYYPPGVEGTYVVRVLEATPAEITRAERILDAAVLQIIDKAPDLFTGPAPLNTNPFDAGNYTEGT